jgi:hypothetical protein
MCYIIICMLYWMNWNYWKMVNMDYDPGWLGQGIEIVKKSKTDLSR